MKRRFGLIGGVLAVALALIYLALFRSEENTAAQSVRQPDTPAATRDTPAAAGLFPRRAHASATNALARRAGAPRRTGDGGAPRASSAADAETEEIETPEPATDAEQAVAAWDALIDQAAEEQEAPTADQAQRVKEAFDRLEEHDKMEAIHTALNLLPDEQFLLLHGILFNKQEDPDILDDIFSDMLNRPEEIKVPVMKVLMADKSHPMFVEAARILDVTGELDDLQDEPAEGQADGQAAGDSAHRP